MYHSLQSGGNFFRSGGAGSGVVGVGDHAALSSWVRSVKLPPSGCAGSLSEGVSTFLFLLADQVSRRTTFLRERIALERAGDATVAAD